MICDQSAGKVEYSLQLVIPLFCRDIRYLLICSCSVYSVNEISIM